MNRSTRRDFLVQTAAAGAALSFASPRLARAANAKLRHACIGCGGQGGTDRGQIAGHGSIEIAALCDIDANHLDAAAGQFPNAKKFRDWRELFDKMGDRIDSVNISVPDHMHAPIALAALKLGKHVYCQKPLCHTVDEALRLRAAAEQSKGVSQMGIQHHSSIRHAMARALIQAGVIGKVRQTHTWTDRPGNWWGQGQPLPDRTDDVPAHVDWDLWLGVAARRPYISGRYHPFQWRGVVDFGTGACGDMAIHLLDVVVDSLALAEPTQVLSRGPVLDGPVYPAWAQFEYQFPATEFTDSSGVKAVWYEAGRKPGADVVQLPEGMTLSDNGSIFIGEKGMLLHWLDGGPVVLPRELMQGVERPRVQGVNHWHQWVESALGNEKPAAPFSYASHLTLITLLGNIAMRFGEKPLHWDATQHTFTNVPEANALLKKTYRDGWGM